MSQMNVLKERNQRGNDELDGEGLMWEVGGRKASMNLLAGSYIILFLGHSRGP
jgi:hypothetical protein